MNPVHNYFRFTTNPILRLRIVQANQQQHEGQSAPRAASLALADVWDKREELFGVGEGEESGTPRPPLHQESKTPGKTQDIRSRWGVLKGMGGIAGSQPGLTQTVLPQRYSISVTAVSRAILVGTS